MVYWSNYKKHYSPETYQKYISYIRREPNKNNIKTYDRVAKQRKFVQ